MKRMASTLLLAFSALSAVACAPLTDTSQDDREKGLVIPALY